ncbi:MAG: hypothetical protein QW379_02225 [Thermoplasmata archaeon]
MAGMVVPHERAVRERRLSRFLPAIALLLTALAASPPTGGLSELFTLSSGELSRELVITVPPGSNSSASVLLPADCTVLSGSLEVVARPIRTPAFISDAGIKALLNGSSSEGLAPAGGELRLAQLTHSFNLTNWRERSGKGIDTSGEELVLEKNSGTVYFTPNSRPAPSNQSEWDPAIAAGPDNEIYIAWVDQRDYDLNIYFSRSLDRGASFSTAVCVNDDSGVGKNLQDSPDVAVGPDGTVYVVWMDNRSGDNDVYIALSKDRGATFSPNRRVDDGPAGTNQSCPSIAVGPSGVVIVVWEDDREGDIDIRCAFSSDGTVFGASARINTDASGKEQLRPRAAAGPHGDFHIVWYDNRSGDFDIYYSRFSGGTFLPEVRVDSSGDSHTFQALPDVAVGGDGRAHIVWHDMRSGYYRVMYSSTQDGRTFSTNMLVDPPSGPWKDQYQPKLTVDRDGVIHVVWHDRRYGDPDIFYANSTNGGGSFNPSVRVDDTAREVTSYSPVVCVDSFGDIHVAWQDNRTRQGSYGFIFQTFYARGLHPYLSSGFWESQALDLGEIPASFTNASADIETPHGTAVGLFLRSSNSSSGPWTDWVPVDRLRREGALPPAEFVQWRVELNTSLPSATPRISSLNLEWNVYVSSGVLTSRPVQFNETLRSATASWVYSIAGAGPASLRLELSANNGSSWLEASPGQTVEFPAMGRVLVYRFRFAGSSSSSPSLSSVYIDLRTESLPSDLRLSLGRSSAVVWTRLGGLAPGEPLASPELREPLNRAIIEERRLGRDTASVCLNFFSSTPGIIEVRNIRIVYDLPPRIISQSPPSEVSMDEGSSRSFSVEVLDPDNDPLTGRWLLDGVQVASGTLSFAYRPDHTQSGVHTLTFSVSDGVLSSSASWTVTVRDVNRPPEVERFNPPSPVPLRTGETVRLEARVADPDGDVLLYTWYADGELAATGVDYFDFTAPAVPGGHIVRLNVSDGWTSVGVEWVIDVFSPKARGPAPDRPLWTHAVGALLLLAAVSSGAAYIYYKKRVGRGGPRPRRRR